jgi:hypothetical protein
MRYADPNMELRHGRSKINSPTNLWRQKRALIFHGFTSERSKRGGHQKFKKSGQCLHVTVHEKTARKPKKAQLQIYCANQGFLETASILPVIVTPCQAFLDHRACRDTDH